MKETGKKHWKKNVVFLLLLSGVIWGFREQVAEGFREIELIAASKKAGIFAVSVGYMTAEGRIIYELAKAFDADISWKKGIACGYYCFFFRTVTVGSGGGAAEIFYLNRSGMEPACAANVSVLQYLCQRITLTLLGCVGAVLFYQDIGVYVVSYKRYIVYVIGITVFITIAILLLLLSSKTEQALLGISRWAGKKNTEWREWLDQFRMQFISGQEGVKLFLRDRKKLMEAGLLNIVKYCCWFSVPYILYGETAGLSLQISIMLMAIATILAMVIPVPGGYGALEFMQILLFEPILGRSKAISLVILYRTATTLFPAFVGGALAIFNRQSSKAE